MLRYHYCAAEIRKKYRACNQVVTKYHHLHHKVKNGLKSLTISTTSTSASIRS